jgi:hypothetical protein
VDMVIDRDKAAAAGLNAAQIEPPCPMASDRDWRGLSTAKEPVSNRAGLIRSIRSEPTR